MRKATRYARTSALPAIAAALALSSTNALAQEVPAQPTPTVTDPAPVSAEPAPVVDSTPATPDTAATTPDTSAPTRSTTKTVHKRTTIAKAAAPAPVRTVTKQTTTRTAHAVVPAAAAPAPAPTPVAPAAPVVSTSAVKPIVDTTPQPGQHASAKPASSSGMDNTTALELGGGVLALFAIGAAAAGIARRRRNRDEMIYDETYEPETAVAAEPEMAEATPSHQEVFEEQPAIVAPAPSAFAWGNQQSNPQECDNPTDDGSDRCPGESWVERAYRGPSPANPSVSLKHRLKRAAFFDQRERAVEAGTAEPVEADAGLPDAMMEEQERELA